MATYLTVTAIHDGSVENQDIRDALRGIDSEAISQSSPVNDLGSLSTARQDTEAEDGAPTYSWVIRTGDRAEEFTKKTTDAIVSAISTINGVMEVDVDGGYEAESETGDED